MILLLLAIYILTKEKKITVTFTTMACLQSILQSTKKSNIQLYPGENLPRILKDP